MPESQRLTTTPSLVDQEALDRVGAVSAAMMRGASVSQGMFDAYQGHREFRDALRQFASDLHHVVTLARAAPQWEKLALEAVNLRPMPMLVRDPNCEIAQNGKLPEPPWAIGSGHGHNAKRAGWEAFFAGKPRERVPFPSNRRDLHDAYREGWDAAKAHPFPDPEQTGAELARLEGRERP